MSLQTVFTNLGKASVGSILRHHTTDFANAVRQKSNGCFVLGLATSNPKWVVTKEMALGFAEAVQTTPHLKKIYDATGIERRCIAFDPRIVGQIELTPQRRSDLWWESAKELTTAAILEAMTKAGVEKHQIGSLIFMSTTECRAPGIDVALVNQLGFDADVKRTFLGWMGCGAAINGLELARNWVMSGADVSDNDDGRVALHVAIDLPSYHMSFDRKLESAIFHALMGDGCSATILGGEKLVGQSSKGAEGGSGLSVELADSFSLVVPGTEDIVSWGVNIGANLSKDLSDIVQSNIGPALTGFLAKNGLHPGDVDHWCVHPGGPRIIEAVERSLGLGEHQTRESWEVLRNFGNMISPTVMFVVERVLERLGKEVANDASGSSDANGPYKTIVALGFSPGVSVDGVLLKCYRK